MSVAKKRHLSHGLGATQGQLSTGMLPKPTYLETYFDGYFGINPQLTVGFSKEVSLPKDKQRINLCKLTGVGTFFMIGVDVIIDKIAGPTINVGPQFNAKANLIFAPWSEQLDMTAKVTAGCAGEVGAKIKVFGYELADWKWPFELGPQKTIFEYPKK